MFHWEQYKFKFLLKNYEMETFEQRKFCIFISRLTVVSCEAKKKRTFTSSGLRDHYSELFTWMAAPKFKRQSHHSCITYLITDLARSI